MSVGGPRARSERPAPGTLSCRPPEARGARGCGRRRAGPPSRSQPRSTRRRHARGELDDAVVKERHATFNGCAHQHLVAAQEHVVRKVRQEVAQQHPPARVDVCVRRSRRAKGAASDRVLPRRANAPGRGDGSSSSGGWDRNQEAQRSVGSATESVSTARRHRREEGRRSQAPAGKPKCQEEPGDRHPQQPLRAIFGIAAEDLVATVPGEHHLHVPPGELGEKEQRNLRRLRDAARRDTRRAAAARRESPRRRPRARGDPSRPS